MPNSRAFTILNTLISYDIVVKEPRTKTYRLGFGNVYLARNVIDNLDIREIASPSLKNLAYETDSSTHLGLIDGDRFYMVAREENKKKYGYSVRVGARFHLTHRCHGKAIIAFMPDEDAERIIAGKDTEFYGEDKPLKIDYLKKELEKCRKTGYAVDLGETGPDIFAIGSPVLDAGGTVIGAIVLIGVFPKSKIKNIGPKVTVAAGNISKLLGYRGKFP